MLLIKQKWLSILENKLSHFIYNYYENKLIIKKIINIEQIIIIANNVYMKLNWKKIYIFIIINTEHI